ncbi:MAG: two-component regulator propeller domain-containing protein [Wenzhouxiangellaceae bacterium]|nr:two-component regulator propeller domain-containing protein [Wenzhouxiangellaceae bacterium]
MNGLRFRLPIAFRSVAAGARSALDASTRAALLVLLVVAADAGAMHPDAGAYTVRSFGVADGLPQSQVRVVHQDPVGYLWFGTQGGLARFNGREFVRFSSANGLAGNQIDAIASDADGRLWVGTNLGVCRLAGARFECHDSEYLSGQYVHAVAALHDALWVGTDRGLVRLRASDSKVTDRFLPGEAVRALAVGKMNSLWIGTDSGLHRLGLDDGVIEPVDLAPGRELAVTALLPDGERFWVGTEAGLFACGADGDTRRVTPEDSLPGRTTVTGLVLDPNGGVKFGTHRGLYRAGPDGGPVRPVTGMGDEIVRALFSDREGTVWVGADSGVRRLVRSRFRAHDRSTGLLADFVRALAQDAHGRFWLGTRVGLQVVPAIGGRLDFEAAVTVTREDGLPNDRIYAIEFPADGGALLATNGGVVELDRDYRVARTWTSADGLPVNHIRSLRLDSDGVLWIGTASGMAMLRGDTVSAALTGAFADAYVIDIREDASGRLWLATRDHGLLVRAPDGRLTQIDHEDGFSNQTVWHLAPDGSGGMWVGTNGDGLFRIDTNLHVAAHLTERDGLANDFVWSVLVDDQGRIWAYTTRGLSRYDGTRFVNFDRNDGLLHLEGGATGALRDRNGQLWFASVGGMVRYAPTERVGNDLSPPVVIESVTSGGEPIDPARQLPYSHDGLNFEFTALTFQDPAATRYQYRLTGLDEGWNELEGYRPVTYAHLPAGRFEFQVRAANGNGVWSSEPARFAFSVTAPVWARGWFVALSLLVLAALVAGGVRLRVRSLRRQSSLLAKMVRERTRDLEQANKRLGEAATTDTLTGLKNRRFLMDQIEHDIAYCRREFARERLPANAGITFLLIDLDGFKRVNDVYGHQAGDRMLQQIGETLLATVRSSDYVIRWGGDEFLVVARHSEPAAGARLARQILAGLRTAEFGINRHDKIEGCSASIGICRFPFAAHAPEMLNWEQVVEIADAAAYLGKRDGGGCWVSIEATDASSSTSDHELLQEVRTRPYALETAGRIRIRSHRDESPPS